MTRWAALVTALLAGACSGGPPSGNAAVEATPTPRYRIHSSSADCPSLPEGLPDTGLVPLWPDEEAKALVPPLGSLCATPTSPYLFGLLNEEAGWASGDLEAAALGLLHRGDEPVGTFTAMRIAAGTPGLEEAAESLGSGGAALTVVGDLTLAWARAGDHVAVYWFTDQDVVSIASDGAAHAAEAAGLWLRAGDGDQVVPPDDIPALGPMPPALEAGPPLAGLPLGYRALPMDPISFMAADFADAITMHGDKTIDALGAAVLLSKENRVLGTVVAGAGTTALADWARELTDSPEDIAAAGFETGAMSGFVVGYEQHELDEFVDAWQRSLAEEG